MRITRRDMIRLGLVAGGAAVLPVGRLVGTTLADEADGILESPPVEPFQVALPIPPIIRPVRSSGATDFYRITQKVTRLPILPGRPATTMWGYNGIVPGPTFMVDRSRTAVVRQINRLPVPVTVHRHGGVQAPEDDGYPLDLIEPGRFRDYVYPGGTHEAATLWYHDHAIHETGRNVWRGLAGFFLITDAHERSLDLPRGRFDIPVVIQDRFFRGNGSIFYPTNGDKPLRQGVFGDVILANGAPTPVLRVARRKYRFRFLNGSNARIYKLALSTGDPLTVIASDDGLFAHPVEADEVTITSAERFEAIIDFSRYPIGTKVVLENRFEDDPGDPFDPERTRRIMRFDVVSDATDRSSVPRDLRDRPQPGPASAVRTRDWRFERRHGAWVINGKLFGHHRVDAFPHLDQPEIWRFINNSGGWIHPIHPHASDFRILDRNGHPPRPYERGPKDTVSLGPNEVIRVLMRFTFKGLFVFHCHNIEHEDHDMMTQFKIV